MKPISPWQFAVFRVVLGVYLVQHFAFLIPWGPELFSREGVLADPSLNFTYGLFPDPLAAWDSPAVVTAVLVALLLLSLALTLGVLRRTVCLLLWFGWACLFNRNNLISNPSIPYVGIILLLMVVVPPGEPLSVRLRRSGSGRRPGGHADWYFPWMVYFAAWTLMGAGYTFSGMDKLLNSPSWQDGTAFRHLVDNPLARPGMVRDLFLHLPSWMHKGFTWGGLALEVLFLPLCLTRPTRALAWTLMVGMHLGILALVAFADLTFGMLMLHLFTFDPQWLPPRRPERGRAVVFFDGVCALCHGAVRFLLAEDRGGVLSFAPLQGETFGKLGAALENAEHLDSLVYVRGCGGERTQVFVRSDATLQVLRDIGGFWRVVSWLRVIPRPVRDPVYDLIASHRYRWFGRYDACRLPTAADQSRLLP